MVAQLLNISNEELCLKRKLVEQLKKNLKKSLIRVWIKCSILWKVLVFLLNKQSVYELTLSTNSKHHISNIVGSLLAYPALITSQSRSMDTLPREMSKKKGGTKKTEFMKDRTYFNFQWHLYVILLYKLS